MKAGYVYIMTRELQMKELKRAWKIKLIEETNLDWDDLSPTLF